MNRTDNRLHEGFVEINNQNIPFIVEYKDIYRKVTPEIREGSQLVVTAPPKAAKEEIYFVLNNSHELICEKCLPAKKLTAEKREPAIIELKDGTIILIKGKKVQIKTVRAETHKEPELKRGILTIVVPENLKDDNSGIKEGVSGLFLKIVKNRTDNFVPKYAKLFGIQIPNTEIRPDKAFWAKCIPAKNMVVFNEYLAMLPDDLIEYVVAHELCHFFHPNHKQGFYSTLRKVMPDADKRCREIDNYGAGFIKDE
ncbi:MAG: DUF45 domain-containing protein [Methanomicrobium sp.]|nr:DUF45 domain-containing protein [Methanomicrobium sp.]